MNRRFWSGMKEANGGDNDLDLESLLVLRQAQDEEDWDVSDLSTFLMLSLSKHEERAVKPPTPDTRVLPPEGEDHQRLNLPPLGEVARRAEGGLVSFLVPHAGRKPPTRSGEIADAPSPNPLPLKGARAFFLSPLPVGEGWVRALFPSAFPAKAGTQTLSRRRETARSRRKDRG